jgi:hypothetical protein
LSDLAIPFAIHSTPLIHGDTENIPLSDGGFDVALTGSAAGIEDVRL